MTRGGTTAGKTHHAATTTTMTVLISTVTVARRIEVFLSVTPRGRAAARRPDTPLTSNTRGRLTVFLLLFVLAGDERHCLLCSFFILFFSVAFDHPYFVLHNMHGTGVLAPKERKRRLGQALLHMFCCSRFFLFFFLARPQLYENKVHPGRLHWSFSRWSHMRVHSGGYN